MLQNSNSLPDGLSLRPARPDDEPFLAVLYRSTRQDLRLIDAEDDFIEHLIGLQQQWQTVSYGENNPDAFVFIVEKLGDRIGRVIVHFGEQEVRIMDISLIPKVRHQNLGTGIMQALQRAATQVKVPLTLCVAKHNGIAKQFYARLGFQLAASDNMVDLLVWQPA
ncbi:GNAT family N-acetyltransferase [Candidatus Magnetaquicoccus inordinatus]|uniref:GNAT family N-acetyltransferase n=1 Tax=Candidatus Magnetaquicoccus inordinatus TaxID=2496818 RepID=UPI00102CF8EA|nr:GNAT family N-acetyltransferase [Candidatus Magnetaquicoccus inordinatus]